MPNQAMLYLQAKQAERDGDWLRAAQLWNEHGDAAASMACLGIAEACQKGDQFRALVRERYAKEGIPQDAPAIGRVYEILQECHKEVYNK